jgi:Flp pilus assembly protein TadG
MAERESLESRKGENGQVLVVTVLCLTMLMSIMALAIDVGLVHFKQVQLQTAADAAAIAAGLELGNCGKTVCANMQTAAAQSLIESGITTSTITPSTNKCTITTSTGLTMTINVAPCVLGAGDPNSGDTNMAEVVLTAPQKTFFGIFLGNPTWNLVARAEAGEAYYLSTGGGNCIYTKSMAFNSSTGTFDLTNCGIYDNGNLQTNNGDAVTATTFLYYGSWSPNNCNNSCKWTLGNSQTQPTHTNTAQSDPLASLTPPSKPANSTTASNTTPSTGATLQPGYYANGVNLNSNVSVTLSPGVYYMNGSINVNSGATLTGTGVTLYFTSGSLQMNSGSTVQLSAPTTSTNGTNANMLVWHSTGNGSGMTIDTGSSSYFNGVIYLPNQTLTLNSGSGVNINGSATSTAIDVNSMIVNDSETFLLNGAGGYLGGGGQTLGKFALAE